MEEVSIEEYTDEGPAIGSHNDEILNEEEEESTDELFEDEDGSVYLDIWKIDMVADIIRSRLQSKMHKQASLHTSSTYFTHKLKAYLLTFIDTLFGRLYLCQIIILLAFINGYTIFALLVFLVFDTMLVFCCVHYFFYDVVLTILKNACCWCVVDKLLGRKTSDKGKDIFGVWIYRYRPYYESVFEYALEVEHVYETCAYKFCKMFSAILILIICIALHFSFYNVTQDVICSFSKEVDSSSFLFYNNETMSFEADVSNPVNNNDEYRYYTIEPRKYPIIAFFFKIYSIRFIWNDDNNLSQCEFLTYDFLDNYKTLALGLLKVFVLIFITVRNYDGPGAKQYTRQLQKLRDCNIRFPNISVSWGNLSTIKTKNIVEEVLTILHILKSQIHIMDPKKKVDPLIALKECPAYSHLDFQLVENTSPMELGFLHYFFIDALKEDKIAIKFENDVKRLLTKVCKLGCVVFGKVKFRVDVAGLEWKMSLFQGEDDDIDEILEECESEKMFTLKNVFRNLRVGFCQLSLCLCCCCFCCTYPSHLFDSCVYLDKKNILRKFRSSRMKDRERKEKEYDDNNDDDDDDDEEEEIEEKGFTNFNLFQNKERKLNQLLRKGVEGIAPIFKEWFKEDGQGSSGKYETKVDIHHYGGEKYLISEEELNTKALFIKLVLDLASDCAQQLGVFRTSTAKLFCKVTCFCWCFLIATLFACELVFILSTFFYTNSLVDYFQLSPLEFLGPRNTTELNVHGSYHFRSKEAIQYADFQVFSAIPIYGVYNWSKEIITARFAVYAFFGVFAFLVTLFFLTILVVFQDELEKHYGSFSFSGLYRDVFDRRRLYETGGMKSIFEFCGHVCCIYCEIGKHGIGEGMSDLSSTTNLSKDDELLKDKLNVINKIMKVFDGEKDEVSNKNKKKKKKKKQSEDPEQQQKEEEEEEEEEEEIDLGSYDSMQQLMISALTRLDFYFFESYVLLIVISIFFLFFLALMIVVTPFAILFFGALIHLVYALLFFFCIWCSCGTILSLYIWGQGFCTFCSVSKIMKYDEKVKQFKKETTTTTTTTGFRRREDIENQQQSPTEEDSDDLDSFLESENSFRLERMKYEKERNLYMNSQCCFFLSLCCGLENLEEIVRWGQGGLAICFGCCGLYVFSFLSFSFLGFMCLCSTCIFSLVFLCCMRLCFKRFVNPCIQSSYENLLSENSFQMSKEKRFWWYETFRDVVNLSNESTFNNDENSTTKYDFNLDEGDALSFNKKNRKKVIRYNPKPNEVLPTLGDKTIETIAFLVALRKNKFKEENNKDILEIFAKSEQLEKEKQEKLLVEASSSSMTRTEREEEEEVTPPTPKTPLETKREEEEEEEEMHVLGFSTMLEQNEVEEEEEEVVVMTDDDDDISMSDSDEKQEEEKSDDSDLEEEKEEEEEGGNEIPGEDIINNESEEQQEQKEQEQQEQEENIDDPKKPKMSNSLHRKKLAREMIHSWYERDLFKQALIDAKECADEIGTNVLTKYPLAHHNEDIRKLQHLVQKLVRKTEIDMEAHWEEEYNSGWEFCKFILLLDQNNEQQQNKNVNLLPRGRFEKIMDSPRTLMIRGKQMWKLLTSERKMKGSDQVVIQKVGDLYRSTSRFFGGKGGGSSSEIEEQIESIEEEEIEEEESDDEEEEEEESEQSSSDNESGSESDDSSNQSSDE